MNPAIGAWGTGDNGGSAGSAGSAGQPGLELAVDGGFTGSDGCNRLFGSWTAGPDHVVTFSPVGSTRMACPGVDTWLSRMASAHVDGDALHVSDESGVAIGTLQRRAADAQGLPATED